MKYNKTVYRYKRKNKNYYNSYYNENVINKIMKKEEDMFLQHYLTEKEDEELLKYYLN